MIVAEDRNIRTKKFGEVFTPIELVNKILDKLPEELWQPGKTFCDPACGNGNMLVCVLERKLKIYKHNTLASLQSIYGVDIMQDNIKETRLRLLKLVDLLEPINKKHVEAVLQNIVWVNPKSHPGGALDYNFSFKANNNIKEWLDWISKGMLEEVNLPVLEAEFGQQKVIFE